MRWKRNASTTLSTQSALFSLSYQNLIHSLPCHTSLTLTRGMDDFLLDGPGFPRPYLVLIEQGVEVICPPKLTKSSQDLQT